MQIDGVYLMPQTSSTNTTADSANLIKKEASFRAQLQAAADKLEKPSNAAKIMTDAETAQRNAQIKEASVQLEAIMLKMLYNEMWKTVPKGGLFKDDNAMEIYRDMYNEELTKVAAEGGGIGLADFIYRQLTETNPHKRY